MGASAGRLMRLAVAQTAFVGAAGLAAGIVLLIAARLAIITARPKFTVLLTAGSALRVTIAAFAMAAVAALVPATRLARLDPAVAYQGS